MPKNRANASTGDTPPDWAHTYTNAKITSLTTYPAVGASTNVSVKFNSDQGSNALLLDDSSKQLMNNYVTLLLAASGALAPLTLFADSANYIQSVRVGE